MSKVLPYIGVIVAILGGGASGSLITLYSQKDDYAISAESCSTRGPEKAYLENIDTGYRVEVPNAIIPAALERITTIKNTGRKSITDEDLHIAIDLQPNTKLTQTLLFYESPLAKHEILSDDIGQTFRIHLKNFNPSDAITLVVASTREVKVGMNSKGAGYTLHSLFSPGESCGWLFGKSYGGAIAYSKVADDCEVDRNLSLSCKITDKIHIPADFPPGRARLFFR